MTAVYIILTAVIIYILYRFLNVRPKGFENISSTELNDLMKVKKVDLIDVRTNNEMKSGVIGKPKWLELDKNFKVKASRLDKEGTYVVYCRSGRRSAIASKMLSSMGFENVFNLTGGYMSYDKK